ncbi:hypothetical protein INR77_07260 [Erythrobacter sp. SCSIO 43205]|uniref:hypothetical protein n=1 Tax=Erythrobacter sp. SCSIO 43205 TaxID=2779361 RepID=UPI001CA94D59|nr:hypothetical protein [Erythrobacter sp. SCSIO 43205]UAB79452.1 hypothetical protein INR77_07260 [Erythrobacter sp. SCSIO 43205]
MSRKIISSLAMAVPRPVRRALKTQVLPPVLRSLRRVQGRVPAEPRAREYRVAGHETFAGYYEVQPMSADGGAVLAHAAKAARTAVTGREAAQVGWFDVASGKWHPVAETQLWCWQMGARLRWWDSAGPRTLAFNAVVDGAPVHCIAEEGSAARKHCDVPLFDVNEEAGVGLSLNFARLAKCRPGYGYPLLDDPFAAQNMPEGDGVTLVDLASGKAELAYSLPDFAQLVPGAGPHEYHYLNAALLSPEGSRFTVLYKRLPNPEDVHGWTVDAVIGNCNGSGLTHVKLPGRASHYWWLDEDRIVYTSNSGITSQYLVFDCRDGSLKPLSAATPGVDGHPSQHAQSGAWVTDTYPDLFGEQTLFVLDDHASARRELGRLWADKRYQDEWRCDLHPRWSRDGGTIVVDSTHKGYRALYLVDARL